MPDFSRISDGKTTYSVKDEVARSYMQQIIDGGVSKAVNIKYDNTDSGLSATDIQKAVDEVMKQMENKATANHTHNYAGSSSAGGAATTATKLATARTIAISGGATGTATNFDGTSNITIPVTALDPSKLSSAVPVAKGGTGATTASGALTNLGLTATATELNYTDGVTSNIQTQINEKTGKVMAETTVYPDADSTGVIAGIGAEILNDYRERYKGSVAYGNTASGSYALATGCATTASGNYSFTTGMNTKASGDYSFASGQETTASGTNSFATGYATTASGPNSFVTGYFATVSGASSFATGCATKASGNYSFTTGMNTKASGDYSFASGRETTASGANSFATGYATTASKDNSFASGYCTEANGTYSSATGNHSVASGADAFATGYYTEAYGSDTLATGYKTKANGNCSFTTGCNTKANGNYSTAMGYYNIANLYQLVAGMCNVEYAGSTGTTGSVFIVGVGTGETARKNAFRITNAGDVLGTKSYTASGADFAEAFEWLDGNNNNEDRRGLFVTLDGDKIKLANDDDYIAGVVSAVPTICGDMATDNWNKMYLTDIFGANLTEEIEVEETIDESGNTIPKHTETRFILNPEYNHTQRFVGRNERKEWASIGVVGKLVMVDDGTCKINGFCKCSKNGIATKSDVVTNYRVMQRLDDTHIRVLIK